MEAQRRELNFDLAKSLIRDGDLLLCRVKQGFGNHLISVASRSPYVHAGVAGWIGGKLFILDILQFHGGRQRELAIEVAEFSGQYDVFGVDKSRFPEFNRRGAVLAMLEYVGCKYGWWNVIRVGLRHLPVFRLLLSPKVDDADEDRFPPFCSQAVANACRAGGHVDPVPNLSDRITEPGDLARSLLFRYRFTLVRKETLS